MALSVADYGTAADDIDLTRDRDLVVRYQHGDRAAFAELYRRYWARLMRFCRRRVNDEHTAEEIAQEAFVRALRAMPTFGGDRRFYPWLSVIAGRLCIDHHRKHARVEPTPDVDTEACDPDHDYLFAAVERQDVAAAVARLSERHRDVLLLREQADLSYQQIADHLGVPHTTVEALLHRARKALRREYLAVTCGRLGGLPAVGLVARVADRLRDGLIARFGEVAKTLGPAAASVATVGAATMMPLVPGVHGPAPPDRTEPPAAVAEAAPAAPAPDAEPAAAAGAPAGSPAPAPAQAMPHRNQSGPPPAGGIADTPPPDGGVIATDDTSDEWYDRGHEIGSSIGTTAAAPVKAVDNVVGGLFGG